MKNTTWVVVGSAMLAVLAGCASSAARLDRVQNGMNRNQVLTLLGTPDGTRVRDNVEYLTYYFPPGPAAGEHPYMVRLVNGQVDTVGRFVQLADLEAVGPSKPTAGMGAIFSRHAFPDVATQLKELAALRTRGEISESEFAQARRDILAASR